jgi:hypothetical protein
MSNVTNALRRAAQDLPESDLTTTVLRRAQDRRARRERLTAGALGVMLTIALIAGVLAVRPGGGEAVRPAAGATFVAGPGQHHEREVRIYYLNDSGASVTELKHNYVWDRKGEGTALTDVRQVFFDSADRAAYEAANDVETGWQLPGGPGTGGGDDSLATSVQNDFGDAPVAAFELMQWLQEGNGNPADTPAIDGGVALEEMAETDAGMWHLLFYEILPVGPGSPAVRAAAVEAASGLEGVHVDRTSIDPAGRPAVALHLVYDIDGWGSADEWIYADPTTLAPMALVWPGWQTQIVANDRIVSTETGDVIENLVPSLDADHVPFPDPARAVN